MSGHSKPIKPVSLLLAAALLLSLAACGAPPAAPTATTTQAPAAQITTSATTAAPTTTTEPVSPFEEDFQLSFTQKNGNGFELTGEIREWKAQVIKNSNLLLPDGSEVRADGREKWIVPLEITLTYQSGGFEGNLGAFLFPAFPNRQDIDNFIATTPATSSIDAYLIWGKPVSKTGEQLKITGYYFFFIQRTPNEPNGAFVGNHQIKVWANFTGRGEGTANVTWNLSLKENGELSVARSDDYSQDNISKEYGGIHISAPEGAADPYNYYDHITVTDYKFF